MPDQPRPLLPRAPIRHRLPVAPYRRRFVTSIVSTRAGIQIAGDFRLLIFRSSIATLKLQRRNNAAAETSLPRAKKTLRGNVHYDSETLRPLRSDHQLSDGFLTAQHVRIANAKIFSEDKLDSRPSHESGADFAALTHFAVAVRVP